MKPQLHGLGWPLPLHPQLYDDNTVISEWSSESQVQGPYAVLGKSLLSAGGREGLESQVSGKGRGFCPVGSLIFFPCKKLWGTPALRILTQAFSATIKRSPREEGILGCDLSLIPCQAAKIYWRWVCEAEFCQGEIGTREMETANSQGVFFGKIHYWGLMLLLLMAAENQECHLQTAIHKHSVSLPSTLTS